MNQNSINGGFSIEIAINANKYQHGDIAEILGVWDRTSPELLMIGQWRNHLIIRVRSRKNKNNYREFDAESIFEQNKSRLIQIVSAKSKTVIYVNGILSGDSIFEGIIPETGLRGRLILGNSATASNPWPGEIFGIAFYQRGLSPEEIALRFSQWNLSGRTELPQATRAAHLFQFNEGSGRVAHDCKATGFDLQIPKLFHIIKKQVLVGPWDDFSWSYSYFSDIAINLFGFMPLGFFMCLFLSEVVAIFSWKKKLLLTIFICFILSISIELIQVYIPTRDSQLSDLICNTLGGAVGGIFAKMIVKIFVDS